MFNFCKQTIWIACTIACYFACSLHSFGGERSFTKAVKRVMGEQESRQTVRESALLEVKRQTLEEAGVLVTAATSLQDVSRESGSAITDTSEFSQQVQALAAGITRTEIVSEEWKNESGSIVLFLTCKVTVDPEDMQARIRTMAEERRRQTETTPLQDEMTHMKRELDELRKFAERSSTPVTVQSVQLPDAASLDGNAMRLDKSLAQARALYERGLYDEAAGIIKQQITLQGPTAAAHLLLGQVYAQKKGWYNLAVRELERAEELAPASPEIKVALATVHLRIGKKPQHSIPLLEKAIRLNPEFKVASTLLEEARQQVQTVQNTFR